MNKGFFNKIYKWFERFLFALYPPYLGAGVRVKYISDDYLTIDVEMKLRFWNRNYVNTHFGGSLYSMVDPFIMFILMKNLGMKYIVWDKKAKIQFKRPGKGRMRAEFRFKEEDINHIRFEADKNDKYEPEYKIEDELPENYIWLTLNQVFTFIKFNNYMNIQARNVVSLISFI